MAEPTTNNYGKFTQTQKTAFATLTGAVDDISLDAPANLVSLGTIGANGALLSSLTAVPRATATATALYLFVSKDSGTTMKLVDSALLEAHTVATTTAIPVTTFANITEDTPLRLEAGDELYVGAGVALASGIVVTAEYSEF